MVWSTKGSQRTTVHASLSTSSSFQCSIQDPTSSSLVHSGGGRPPARRPGPARELPTLPALLPVTLPPPLPVVAPATVVSLPNEPQRMNTLPLDDAPPALPPLVALVPPIHLLRLGSILVVPLCSALPAAASASATALAVAERIRSQCSARCSPSSMRPASRTLIRRADPSSTGPASRASCYVPSAFDIRPPWERAPPL